MSVEQIHRIHTHFIIIFTIQIVLSRLVLYAKYLLQYVREGVKTPSHGKSPPPPGPQRTRFFCKVSEKNLTDKGGTPPPLNRRKIQKIFAASGHFLVFFTQKHCF